MAFGSVHAPATASPFCRPEEDPFLLLESSLRAVQEILLRRRGLPLLRCWSEQPYGEEEISLLRVDAIDQQLQAEQEQRCQPEAECEALGALQRQGA